MRSARDEEFRSYVLEQRAGLVRTATLLAAGDRHLAEDVVQTTLTRLYVAWPRFRKATNPGGYARRTLVNALVDEHRRPWRRREHVLPTLPERSATEPDADTTATEALHAALRDLPPRMRAALVYRYFHDLSVADTADALSCSEGTVKSQTARALDRLRAVLDDAPAPSSSAPSRLATTPGATDV